MAAKKKKPAPKRGRDKRGRDDHGPEDRKKSGDRYTVSRVGKADVWQLSPPRSVVQRKADMDEVRSMIEAGEVDVAVDELRWLIEGCHSLLEAHKLLGDIALADKDLELARGHFGYAYELGLKAIPDSEASLRLPYARPANRTFFEAGQGLVRCLVQQGERKLAAEAVKRLTRLDPSDPLGLKSLLNES